MRYAEMEAIDKQNFVNGLVAKIKDDCAEADVAMAFVIAAVGIPMSEQLVGAASNLDEKGAAMLLAVGAKHYIENLEEAEETD